MEATTLLLPGSLEPQLGLSVAPLAEHVIRISSAADAVFKSDR